MIFTAERVEFETSEQWFVSKFGFGVAYDQLLDVAAYIEPQLNDALEREVNVFVNNVESGVCVDEACYRASQSAPEASFLADRLRVMSRVLLGADSIKYYLASDEVEEL